MTAIEEKIIELLQEGKTLSEVSAALKSNDFKPYSIGAIDKIINGLKAYYRAYTPYQLAFNIQNMRWEQQSEEVMTNAFEEGYARGRKNGVLWGIVIGLVLGTLGTILLT